MMITIRANEFSSLEEADRAQASMPMCADCNSGVKVQVIQGHVLVRCIKRPHIHFGMKGEI